MFVFLPTALLLFFSFARYVGRKSAVSFLVIASFVFYSYWNIRYLPLLIFSILFNFCMGSAIERYKEKKLIYFGIAGNLALLGYFKYANFLVDNVNTVFGTAIHLSPIILPIGISFFTFTQIAYLVDAHHGETSGYGLPEYSLFACIFPHLIAGPILHHKSMIPQFSDPKTFRFSYASMTKGVVLFSMGLFKKVVIADNLAPLADFAFKNPSQMTFVEAWQGSLAYALQLYFDFSAYSEMAIALGYMLNLNLPVNFNSPYKSKSIIEFWRRWHITLSDFLKFYLYIPLGGNRLGQFRKMLNLFLTMLLAGLWHGAGWTFVLWGALHGFYLVVNHSWRRAGFKAKFLSGPLSWATTFLCVIVAWVFFRSSSISNAFLLLKGMFGFNGIILPAEMKSMFPFLAAGHLHFATLRFGLKGIALVAIVSCLCLLPNPLIIMKYFRPNRYWFIAACFLLFTSIFSLHKITEFLYFQF